MALFKFVLRRFQPKVNVTAYTDFVTSQRRVLISCHKGYLSSDGGWVADISRAHDFGTDSSAVNWAEASGFTVTRHNRG
jgi:hypothetical protein